MNLRAYRPESSSDAAQQSAINTNMEETKEKVDSVLSRK